MKGQNPHREIIKAALSSYLSIWINSLAAAIVSNASENDKGIIQNEIDRINEAIDSL